MLKKDALEMFDTNKLDRLAYGIQSGKIKLIDIPEPYQTATHMVLTHGCDWWKYL